MKISVKKPRPETVSKMAENRPNLQAAAPVVLQRYADPQTRRDIPPGEELLQGDFTAGTARKTHSDGSTSLPSGLQEKAESLSGLSLSEVRVHEHSDKPARIGARAYAQGSDIYLSGNGGGHSLAHELVHVVQQKQGLVAPTTRIGGIPVNSDPTLEREADNFHIRQLALAPHADAVSAPLQGDFIIGLDASVHNSGLSQGALNKINSLRQDLTNTYGQMYDSTNWLIEIAVEIEGDMSPAYTSMVNFQTIQVVLKKWFLENCRYGELLGMVNHELNVHEFANIAILTSEKLLTGNVANPQIVGALGQSNPFRNHPQQERLFLANAEATTAAWVPGPATPAFIPGHAPLNMSLPMTGHNPSQFESVEQSYQAPLLQTTQQGANQPVLNQLNQESPQTHTARGGQRDHSFMSQMSFNAVNQTILFSPRALVYAQMTVKQIDDFVTGRGAQLDDPMQQQVVADMLGYFFLDVARTWHEGLTGTFIQDIHWRNYLFALNGDQMEEMVVGLFQWLFDNQGFPNGALGITISPAAAQVVVGATPAIHDRITSQRSHLLNLFSRALWAKIFR